MSRNELRAAGLRLLADARALRAAFPAVAAMRTVSLGEVGSVPLDRNLAEFHAAMRHLQAEMVVVRDGRADSLAVLDDEIANVVRLLPAPEGEPAPNHIVNTGTD
ncbi:MAG: hypothetical protein J0I06_02910 [Planctomycetes bacterium]|nr:hypothetical protein [Planctomycetota bacterium]